MADQSGVKRPGEPPRWRLARLAAPPPPLALQVRGVQDGALGAEPTKSARTLPIFLGGRRLNHSSCRPPLLWLTPLRHRVGSQPPGPVRPRPRPPPLLGPQARRRANADPWSRGAGAESAARKIQGGRAAQEAGAQFAAPTSRWPGRARTRQRSRPARPARAGGAADSALSDPPRAHLPGLLGSTRAGPLAGPAENHKPARKLRALSSSRQGPGRRLKKGVKIHPPPLTTFPRRGSRLPDPAAPARLQPSSGTAWCQSAAQSGGSGLLRPCWPQAPPGHSQPAGKGEPGETGIGESHIVFE